MTVHEEPNTFWSKQFGKHSSAANVSAENIAYIINLHERTAANLCILFPSRLCVSRWSYLTPSGRRAAKRVSASQTPLCTLR